MTGQNTAKSTTQVQMCSIETIKPSAPTHSHLKRYNLSSTDQIMFRNYIPIVLFFRAVKTDDISLKLKQSLTKTLAIYYPFAGKLSSETFIDCNDNGIEFHEEEIKSSLSDILHIDHSNVVFPRGLADNGFRHDSSLMVVKLTHFNCGGIAIAVCLSHKVADACTFSTFLAYWGTMTRQSGEELSQSSPYFISHQPTNDPITKIKTLPYKNNLVTKKFVFHNSHISRLKSMVSSSNLQNYTRFDVVTALLFKCAISAAKSSSGCFRPSVLLSAVNTRSKMIPPLPKESVGNILGQILVTAITEDGVDLTSFADQINKGRMQMQGGGLKILDIHEAVSAMKEFGEKNYKVYMCTSLCNFGLYNVDFGCGKPVRVIHAGPLSNSSFYFMDTPSGDGIEASVSLDEQDMVHFELHQELLTYVSLD